VQPIGMVRRPYLAQLVWLRPRDLAASAAWSCPHAESAARNPSVDLYIGLLVIFFVPTSGVPRYPQPTRDTTSVPERPSHAPPAQGSRACCGAGTRPLWLAHAVGQDQWPSHTLLSP
jgi:hypothetical protein